MKTVGVLALQGDFAAHARMLEARANVQEVKHVAQLDGLDGLVLPGGESTTLLHLMRDEPWFEALARFHGEDGALFATCAGAILLAREVEPAQPSLGLVDITVQRNAYGRQVDSFEADVAVTGLADALRAVFIRAPRFTALGPDVRVLACWQDEPILVRQGRILAAAFHPEIAGDDRLHGMFLELCSRGASPRGLCLTGASGREPMTGGRAC